MTIGEYRGVPYSIASATNGSGLVLRKLLSQRLAAEIRSRFDVKVTAAPGDITTQAGVEATLAVCPAPPLKGWEEKPRHDGFALENKPR